MGTMPKWLKWTGAVLGWIGAGLALTPGHTIAHQIGMVLVGLTAGAGVVSSGTAPKQGGVP